jgi:hypothetical protein
MAEKLAELYTLLVSCGIPEQEASDFVTALPQIGWGAARRRTAFLRKYNDLIEAGIAARSGQVKTTATEGMFR